jgi:4-coumarate--CoA ligase
MIFESKSPARDHPDVSIYQLIFEDNKNMVDDVPCFVDAENHSEVITFPQLKSLVLKFGAGLKRNFPDFSQGDIVAIYSPNDVSKAKVYY